MRYIFSQLNAPSRSLQQNYYNRATIIEYSFIIMNKLGRLFRRIFSRRIEICLSKRHRNFVLTNFRHFPFPVITRKYYKYSTMDEYGSANSDVQPLLSNFASNNAPKKEERNQSSLVTIFSLW
jgi:hypothetical protein